ncbi:RNA polymerase sigma factor [Actinomadura spongiicola]|uniref:RNA polymerase sigma factor n=1 Tax=Actinomadura spongiicola TaxID=2303421 RepID=A0A372GG51_9ACTN|nr:RNA polymerase sigma factor [Actinomadura spongiicola]
MARDLDTGFEALYEAYRGAVFSTALRLCGRWAEAEDLSAEAFLRAYRALCGYGPERIAELRPRAWLLTILTNVWRNSLRTAARRPPPGPLEDAPDPPDPGEEVEDTATRHETGRELAGLLAELPHAQRAAVVLRHVTDLPVAEIATVLSLPEGTVKSHISRGLARLRALRTEQRTEQHTEQHIEQRTEQRTERRTTPLRPDPGADPGSGRFDQRGGTR